MPTASLSATIPTSPTSRVKVKASSRAATSDRAPCGLWAASTSTVGERRTISRRPGEVIAATGGREHVGVERLLAAADEGLDGRDGGGEVARLVGAVQREEEVGVLPGEAAEADLLATEGDLAGEHAEVVALEDDPAPPTSSTRSRSTCGDVRRPGRRRR